MGIRGYAEVAVDTFAQGISYIVRAPVAAVLAFAGMLVLGLGTLILSLELLLAPFGGRPDLGAKQVIDSGRELMPSLMRS